MIKEILKRRQAFTLTEIMVVIIIVGVLASVALMRYQKVMLQSREREAMNQLRAIHSANSVYYSRAMHYLPTGTGDHEAINQGLSLNILLNDLQYQYTTVELDGIPGLSRGDGYKALVTLLDGGGAAIFRIKVDQRTLSTTMGSENPCCDTAGKCPTLPDCT